MYRDQWKVYCLEQANAPVSQAVRYMMEHYREAISLASLSTEVGISKYKLIRLFQGERGVTPMKWLWHYRILKSIELMNRLPQANLQEIALLSGFNSQAHYSRLFKKFIEISPACYRRELLASHPVDREQTPFDSSP